MSATVRAITVQLADEIYPLDQKPLTSRHTRQRTQVLRATLRKMRIGQHFICELSRRVIYAEAKKLAVQVYVTRRKPDGHDVWRIA